MQETIDMPFHSGRPHRPSRWWIVLFALLVLVLLTGRTAVSYYVENLWFQSLGYASVFWKTLAMEWTAFAVFALCTFAILYGWIALLLRAIGPQMQHVGTVWIGRRQVNLPVQGALRTTGGLLALLVSLISGASMMAEWSRFALYWSQPGQTAGAADPVFGHSLGFYLFTLPAWQLVAGWLLVLAILMCIAGAFSLLIAGGSHLAMRSFDDDTLVPWRELSIAVAFLLLVIGLRVYLARFDMLMDDNPIFSGVTYTDAHVLIGGLTLVCIALMVGAGIAAMNLFTRPRLRWLLLAPVPAVVCYVMVQLAGWYVTTFIVKPNQLERERPYIAHNIEFTRRAYGLDRISQQEFPAETNVGAADPEHNQATLQNIRLWDWRALQDTLRQIQEIRTYYDFPDVDIDRYTIDGQMRQVMLAARELSQDKLPESSRNWINEKLIYTHGYGITMNPVNGFTPEGLPTLLLSNMPIQSTVPSLQVKQPEIYYGQMNDTDVYVKTRQKEFNYPQGESNNLTSYNGNGGIVLGGLMRRLLIAFDRGDLAKLPFSDDIGPESRLLMRRNVRAAVKHLAPFLSLDADPYIVVGDNGRLYWMLDAFTTSDTYPYAAHYAFRDDSINYMRNSVKVVVDAYDGATTFYVFDTQDPVLAAYRHLFPALFKDVSAMPKDLHRHIRYPELLLKLQAQVYGLYHMTDPVVFYNREDLWTVASEVGTDESGEQGTHPMEPNYVLMKLPGQSDMEFVSILPFTPANRNNLIGWIAGRSDEPYYGTALVYNFPKTRLVDGPMQIEARIDQNAQLSGQLTLWNQQGSHVRRGSLLVIPCGKALIYAEPIYLQAERSPMPELRLVVLALQDRLAYGATFEAALQSLFAGAPNSLHAEAGSPPANQAPSAAVQASGPSDLQTLIGEAARDLNDYQRLTAEGKLGEAGKKLEDLKQKLNALSSRPK